ncbi:PREDICTED: protein CutA homolog [Nicrophorus vespilloides]|uniref:Protein CutA homolog n=1 Tax=Nicrophorus vespilloides TaxID=110193 RepID=A0ABM1N9E1_NICVS|nr:PREDICTED: protein CutA homolog [Nicrophorus vespilloides]
MYVHRSFLISSLILSLARRMSSSTTTTPAPSTYVSGTHSVAYVTVPDEAVAKKLAHGIVQENLAACVNIIPKITSVYLWKGEINEDSELLLMIKTRTAKVDELTTYVRKNHPYEVCEVISTPIQNGNPPYLNWIGDIVP